MTAMEILDKMKNKEPKPYQTEELQVSESKEEISNSEDQVSESVEEISEESNHREDSTN